MKCRGVLESIFLFPSFVSSDGKIQNLDDNGNSQSDFISSRQRRGKVEPYWKLEYRKLVLFNSANELESSIIYNGVIGGSKNTLSIIYIKVSSNMSSTKGLKTLVLRN
jgi:hypothetical protein